VHSLTDTEILFDADIIGRDQASDLILIIGIDEKDIHCLLIIQHRTEFDLYALVNVFPEINGIIRLHLIDDLRQFVYADLLDIRCRIIHIGHDLCQPLGIQPAV